MSELFRIDLNNPERRRELEMNHRIELDSILAVRLSPEEAQEALRAGFYEIDLDLL